MRSRTQPPTRYTSYPAQKVKQVNKTSSATTPQRQGYSSTKLTDGEENTMELKSSDGYNTMEQGTPQSFRAYI